MDELTKIIKCTKETGLIVLPIFYDVDPTDLRKQTWTFEQAFIDHQKCFKDNIEKVQTWRAALREVANISGWHLGNFYEFQMIRAYLDWASSITHNSSLKFHNSNSILITHFSNFIFSLTQTKTYLVSYLCLYNSKFCISVGIHLLCWVRMGSCIPACFFNLQPPHQRTNHQRNPKKATNLEPTKLHPLSFFHIPIFHEAYTSWFMIF